MEAKDYIEFRKPYERALRQLLLEFDFFKEDLGGVNIHSVQERLKTFESASVKATNLNMDIEELQDIAGMRIIVTTLDYFDVVARFFYRKADSNDLIIKSDRIIKRDGYRARHLVIEQLSGHYSRSVRPTRIEIQIQTLMQHTFNYISRVWIYKSERFLSKEWVQEFLQVSKQLTDLDARISKLQKELIESSISKCTEEPLTPLSYQRIVLEIFNEPEPIDYCVDAVRLLNDLGCDTNGRLRDFFTDPRIEGLRKRYTELQDTIIGKELVERALNMPINRFFMMNGVRLEASEKHLQRLTEVAIAYEKQQTSNND